MPPTSGCATTPCGAPDALSNYRLPKRLKRITRLTEFKDVTDQGTHWLVTIEERTKRGDLLFSHLKDGKKLARFATRKDARDAIEALTKRIKEEK